MVKEALIKTNPEYDPGIKRLYLYYDMKLVTFGIDRKRNLIIQFPIFVQPYTQQPLILYQLETVPVPTVDKNTKANSYTELQIKKHYTALNLETYINIWQQELTTCKRIGYEFYCEELFVVRHKSIHSCKSAIYFDLDKDTIKRNCNSIFYFNKMDITPTILVGGNEIILANWPNDKHIIFTIKNDIPIEIPSHLYVLVNRSGLGNCGIEAENNFLLESLAASQDSNTKLIMYFTVNTAFTNYTDQFNLTEELEMPILTNKTTSEFTLPVFLNKSTFDDTLLSTPLTLKEYIAQYKHEKEIFDLKERHDIEELDIEFLSKNFFTNNFIIDTFVFITVIILVITAMIIIYTLCKHNKLRAIVVSLTLKQVKEVKAEEIKDENYKYEYISQFLYKTGICIHIYNLYFKYSNNRFSCIHDFTG